MVDRARRVQRQTGSRWPILVLGGLVALSAVTVVTKAYQGLLRPDDVGLLGCWVVAIIAWTWHTRRARRAAGDAEVAASPTHGRTSGT